MSHIFLLLGHMQIFFLIMSRFWISVGGFLAFFCICPAFGFLWEVSSPFFAYVLLSDFCRRFPCLFLHMSCFRISVGGSLAFFCICPAFGFLWEVSLPFLAYVLLWDFCGRFPRLFLHMSHLLIPPQNLYQMILICLSTYPVYKFPEQNTLIFLPFRII